MTTPTLAQRLAPEYPFPLVVVEALLEYLTAGRAAAGRPPLPNLEEAARAFLGAAAQLPGTGVGPLDLARLCGAPRPGAPPETAEALAVAAALGRAVAAAYLAPARREALERVRRELEAALREPGAFALEARYEHRPAAPSPANPRGEPERVLFAYDLLPRGPRARHYFGRLRLDLEFGRLTLDAPARKGGA